jgi:hypothetical protein
MLLALAQTPDLKVEETAAIFHLLYAYNLTAISAGQQALSTLARLLQQPELGSEQQIEIAQNLYEASMSRSENRKQAVQVLWKQAQDNTLSPELRLEAATTPLMVRDTNYTDRIQAIRIILTLKQGEDARAHVEYSWQPMLVNGNRVESNDIPAMIELLQQELLPVVVRDEMYRILRQMVPHFGDILTSG